MVWSESYRGSLDDETISASGILVRTHDAGDRVSAGNWPNEAGNHGRAGARRPAVARAGLPRELRNKIDSTAGTSVKTLPQDVTENIRAGFATLFAAVCFVLLIACSNVANLLLVRFSGRRREIALRMAVGASRSSIVRLFVWESCAG